MKITSAIPAKSTGGLKFVRMFRSESGQSLIELALLAPILLLMVIGIAEMGRYAYLSILLGNAAEAGAAYGAESLANSGYKAGISAAAQSDFQNGASLAGLVVTSSYVCACDSGGTSTTQVCTSGTPPGSCTTGHFVVTVNVTATGTFTSLFNWPGIPKSLTVARTVIMRVKPV